MDELYLLRKLKDDDVNALEVIFNRYYEDLCKYLLMLFRNEIVVEHIAQDIFIYLWENRRTIEIKSSLKSYLYSAGRYKALNQLRNKSKQEEINKRIFEVQNGTETISGIEISELEKVIEESISLLPGKCQKIFRLSREEELSYKEIAELLNISINTVENQMSIALKKLRAILRPFYVQILILSSF